MEFSFSENRLVSCPYDETHKLKESRLQIHIAKCKLNHLDKVKEACPFNATHLFPASELNFHLMNCPDRAPIDRTYCQNALDKNNPYKGRTAVPTFSDPINLPEEETWEIDDGPGYVPREPPPDAIIEPRPMSQPAERKKLYKELYRRSTESDKPKTATPAKPVTLRQPKQPSGSEQVQSIPQQQVNMQTTQNLGLGRGKSRIAANIFDNAKAVPRSENPSYSNIVKEFGNLGLGRGQSSNPSVAPNFKDEDDFPALGCGRGVLLAPRQNLRPPGRKTKKDSNLHRG